MTAEYRFTEEAIQDIRAFPEDIQREIFEKIDAAAEKHFYNSESYSKFYDHHGRIWDKLNLEINNESIRAVFIEEEKFLIIFIGDHEDFEYDTDLYNLLKRRS